MSGLPDSDLRAVLQSVLLGVCTSCDFVHGEALKPSHSSSCLVQVRFDWLRTRICGLSPLSTDAVGVTGRPMQTGASHSSTAGGHDFHRASMNFYIPPNVSLDGRVWKTGCIEVSISPARRGLACRRGSRKPLPGKITTPPSHLGSNLFESVWGPDSALLGARHNFLKASFARSQQAEDFFPRRHLDAQRRPQTLPLTHSPPHCLQSHEDVSILPATIFLRADLAAQTHLKAAIGIPLVFDNRVIAVCIFYKSHAQPPSESFEKKVIGAANDILLSSCERL